MPRQLTPKVYANFSGGLVTEANSLQAPDNAVTDIENFLIKRDGSVEVRPGLKFDTSPAITDITFKGYTLANTAINVFKWESVDGDPELDLAVIQVGQSLYFYRINGGVVDTSEQYAPSIIVPSLSTDLEKNINSTDLQAASGGGRLYVVGKYNRPLVLSIDTTEPVKTVEFQELVLRIRDFTIAGEGKKFTGTVYSHTNPFPTVERSWNTYTQHPKEYSLSGEEKQTYVSGAHAYNLINQGWPEYTTGVKDNKLFDGTPQVGRAILSLTTNPNAGVNEGSILLNTLFSSGVERAPTVYESFHEFENGGGDSVDKQTAFKPALMKQTYTGNTFAARGHLIKDAFNIERKACGVMSDFVSNTTDGLQQEMYSFFQAGIGITGSTATAEQYKAMVDNLYYDGTESCYTRPDSIAFYAGRVWYSGQEGRGFSRNIYFSQVVGDDVEKASKCYQAADPTSKDINELVATDGGVLSIEGMGKVLKLVNVGTSLMVITDSGVWAISGDSEGANFTATGYSVRKITSQGALSRSTIVEARDSVIYWSDASINMLSFDAVGAISMQDISSDKIRSYYAEIKDYSKISGYSKYDEGADNVLWFYSDSPESGDSALTDKTVNKVLSLNLSTGAYSKVAIGTTDLIVPVDVISTESSSTITDVEFVTDSYGAIVTANGAAVTASTEILVPGRTSLKLLTLVRDSATSTEWRYNFSEFTDVATFADWGVPYKAFLEKGFDSLGDIFTETKKAPMFIAHLKNTGENFEDNPDIVGNSELDLNVPSSCLVSYSWDWGSSNYKNQFQAYRYLNNYTPSNITDPFSYNRDVISTRTRLRGRGMSLGVRIDSEPHHDMKLLGFGIVFKSGGV